MKILAFIAMATVSIFILSQAGGAYAAGDIPSSTDKTDSFKPEDSTTPKTGAPTQGSTGSYDNGGRPPAQGGTGAGDSGTGTGMGKGTGDSGTGPGTGSGGSGSGTGTGTGTGTGGSGSGSGGSGSGSGGSGS